MYAGDRVTSLTLDALDTIQTTLLTSPMAKEQGIDMDNWDLRATKEVTGYDRVVSLRVRNIRTAWDRGSLRANKVYWRTERSRGGRRTRGARFVFAMKGCCNESVATPRLADESAVGFVFALKCWLQ